MQINYSTNQTNVKYLDINYEIKLLHSIKDEFHEGEISLPESAFSQLWLSWIDKYCEDILRVIAQRIYDQEAWMQDDFNVEIISPDNIPCYNGGVYIACQFHDYEMSGNAYTFKGIHNMTDLDLDVEFVATSQEGRYGNLEASSKLKAGNTQHGNLAFSQQISLFQPNTSRHILGLEKS